MERSFEERKSELKAECKVSQNMFTSVATRLEQFMKPFTAGFRRRVKSQWVTMLTGRPSMEGQCRGIAR